MDDYMWTTRETIDGERETIHDDDARTLLHEQLRRKLTELAREETRLQRRRAETATEVAVDWGRSVARVRDERARMIRAEYPEPPRRQIHDEMLEKFKSWTEKKNPVKKKDTILKPLPDELFELD